MYGIIMQARMGSTRFPGKILKKIFDKTLLQHQVERLQRSKKSDNIVVATTTEPEDIKVENLCEILNIDCYRGSTHDVMERFIKAAEDYGINTIIRVCGDTPLIDAQVVDALIEKYEEEQFDYIYASHRKGWIYGAAAQLFPLSTLKKASTHKLESYHKEHVVPFLHEHPEIFSTYALIAPPELNRPDYYLALDYPEDFELITQIFNKIYPQKSEFRIQDVIEYLDAHPELTAINKGLHSGYSY